ncbi:hypothetical protein GCM10029992_24280 [Glycomyces albus]
MGFPPTGRVTIADGGLATALEARGADLSDRLWSARLLLDAPEEISRAHEAFFEAGAQVATTATYQASLRASPSADSTGPRRPGCCAAASIWPATPATGSAAAGWPPRSGRTGRPWPTARSTAAGTA